MRTFLYDDERDYLKPDDFIDGVAVDVEVLIQEASRKDSPEYEYERIDLAKNLGMDLYSLDFEVDRRRKELGLIPHHPDMSIIFAGQKEPPDFPYPLFQPPIDTVGNQNTSRSNLAKLFEEMAESCGCPPDYAAGPLIIHQGNLFGLF
ncbi:MAG: hypothetical protein JKX88_00855, partial [Marinicaulis sp.]|nr:hypothetical protein [Marinicaulis sp.]